MEASGEVNGGQAILSRIVGPAQVGFQQFAQDFDHFLNAVGSSLLQLGSINYVFADFHKIVGHSEQPIHSHFLLVVLLPQLSHAPVKFPLFFFNALLCFLVALLDFLDPVRTDCRVCKARENEVYRSLSLFWRHMQRFLSGEPQRACIL